MGSLMVEAVRTFSAPRMWKVRPDVDGSADADVGPDVAEDADADALGDTVSELPGVGAADA